MKRVAITLQEIAARPNLLLAVHKAARGKQFRAPVAQWLSALEPNLATLTTSILDGTAPQGTQRRFTIFEPKRREISAACFADRVLHHAILNLAEPRFERMLVPSTFACRIGLGVHAAMQAVQRNLRRFEWCVQVDVQGYFAAIDHAVLKALLARRFKGAGLLALLGRIIDAGDGAGSASRVVATDLPTGLAKGLPIGALTSQHFANAYLDAADRWLLARSEVRAHVRYMDDIVWWCDSAEAAAHSLLHCRQWLADELKLTLKQNARISRSECGLAFCGFRIRPGIVLPSSRKQMRYRQGARRLIGADAADMASAAQLQQAHDVLAASLARCQSLDFRRRIWANSYSSAP